MASEQESMTPTNIDIIVSEDTSATTVSQSSGSSCSSSSCSSSSYTTSTTSSSSVSNVPIESLYEDVRIENLVKEVADLKLQVASLVDIVRRLSTQKASNQITINM